MLRYFSLIFTLLQTAQLLVAQQSQQVTVFGEVTDQLGAPLAGVSISLKNAPDVGTLTDSLGSFSLNTSLSGKLLLTASAIGYRINERILYVKPGQRIEVHFKLLDDYRQLQEVNIKGIDKNQYAVRQLKESGFNVNVVDVNEFGNISTDINQILKRTTGVLIRESGGVGSDFTFQVNGLAAKIYIDDIPMDQFGSSMTLNNIPVNLIDRIEVYKGVVPAHLGSDAMGGAVNIITKQKNRKFLDASYSYGSFNTHQAAITGSMRSRKSGFKIRANGFYNYSDNNYMMYSDSVYNVNLRVVRKDEFATGDNATYRQVNIDKARRFYDAYQSAMGEIEMGYEKVKWADLFTIGLTYAQNKKQLQLGSTVNAVYGGFWTENNYLMPSVRYRKDNFLMKGLHANFYVNYSKSTDHNRDTALYRYDWSGGWAANAGEGDPLEEVHIKYLDAGYVARANLNYALDKEMNHSLNANYVFSGTNRKVYDLMETDPERKDISGLPNKLGKHIAGLAWQAQWLERKLISVVSLKYYGMGTTVVLDGRTFDEYGKPIGGDFYTVRNFFGYPSFSLAARYRLVKDWGIKASAERGYNLPEVSGLFGDGRFVLGNTGLQPERSDNFNLGTYYNDFFGAHFVNLDLSGFYRRSKDYIASVVLPDNLHSQSRNFPGVTLYGVEGEMKYGYKDNLMLSGNLSFDKAIDSWKYTDSTNAQISLTYKEQLPNRPWVYGNISLMLGKRDLIGKGTRLQFNYMYQYVHWFYLTWAKLGSPGSKNFVPGQTVHTAVLAYSWKNDVYNISVEARNFTDERVYDNFRLQKPGRAFYVKFRLSIM